MEKFQKRLATMIRAARKAQSLSQEELGELINKGQGMVGQYERGECYPSLETLFSIIHVLNLDANALFYGESDLNDIEIDEIVRSLTQLDARKRKQRIECIKLISKMD